MSEKEKRKEKTKQPPISWRFIVFAIPMTLIFLLGILFAVYSFISKTTNTPQPLPIPFTREAIETENAIRMTQIAETQAAAIIASPTAGNCGYAIYGGTVESPHVSSALRELLDHAGIRYRAAIILFDAFEAQNNCQGEFIPLPYRCLITQIDLDITREAWDDKAMLMTQLMPLIETVSTGANCTTEGATLELNLILSDTERYTWHIAQATLTQALDAGTGGEDLWQLGTASEE